MTDPDGNPDVHASPPDCSGESDSWVLPEGGIFEGFGAAALAHLSEAGERRPLADRSFFARQGDPQDEMAIILKGKVAVSCQARGELIQLAELGPGEIVGEMSIIDPQNASATVRVIDGDARIWVLTASGFDAFVSQHPDIGFRFLKAIASKLCRRIRKNSDVMLRKSEQTRHRFLDLDY